MSDYRPTSLLNSLSKIYERAMSDWLMEFLNNNRILSNFQFGFRKHFFPQIAVAQLVNNILIDLANIKYIISLFSFFWGEEDLRNAFCITVFLSIKFITMESVIIGLI